MYTFRLSRNERLSPSQMRLIEEQVFKTFDEGIEYTDELLRMEEEAKPLKETRVGDDWEYTMPLDLEDTETAACEDAVQAALRGRRFFERYLSENDMTNIYNRPQFSRVTDIVYGTLSKLSLSHEDKDDLEVWMTEAVKSGVERADYFIKMMREAPGMAGDANLESLSMASKRNMETLRLIRASEVRTITEPLLETIINYLLGIVPESPGESPSFY